MNYRRLLTSAALVSLLGSSHALAQAALQQAGPWAPGHVPQYVGQGFTQPIVQDGGGAGGGPLGTNPGDLGLTVRSPTNTYPAANAGSGPLGTNMCNYDAPTNSASGYHYLCLSPNAQGGGLIAYGAGGVATPMPLNIVVNGVALDLTNLSTFTAATPFTVPGNLASSGDSLNGRLAQQINLKSDFGAKFDAVTQNDGVIVAASNVLSSASAQFTSADCHSGLGCTGATDKVIDIDFAGPACGPLHTTITTVTNQHTVTLASPAICTVGYQYVWALPITTQQSGAGSYAPGDTITLSGGTFTVASTATIAATRVTSATIISGGTLGKAADGTDTGTCYVQGTTGAGATKAIISLTITAGVATSVNSVFAAGVYTTNPTVLANEPVTPTQNCSGLTGAVLSLNMGVLLAQPGTHAHGGQYSVLPASPIATTTNGSGTGLTVSPLWYYAGSFIYGTDDTVAWTNAFNGSASLFNSGAKNCIVMPGGISIITAQLPMWQVGPCIHGQSRDKSLLFLSASFTGNAIWIDNAWINLSGNSPTDGALVPVSQTKYGADLADFSIFGTRFAPSVQRGIIFSDNNDYATASRIFIRALNGSCFGMGRLVNDTRSFTRESNFHDIQIQSCGSATDEAFYIDSTVRGSSNDLYLSDINVYASFGTGMHISANGASHASHVQIDRLRVEGMEFEPVAVDADNLVIGDAVETGPVDGVTIDKAQLVSPYLNRYAVRSDAAGTSSAPFSNHLSGTISGGLPYGGGLHIRYGRASEYHFSGISTLGPNVAVDSTAGGLNEVSGLACNEKSWTYQVSGANPPISSLCYVAQGATTPTISFGANDGTIASGNEPGPGSVNLSLIRAQPSQVPAGTQSVSIGSSNSRSSGNNSTDISSTFAVLSGAFTSAISSFAPIDHSWPTSRILSGFAKVASFGSNQLQETILGCKTAATNAATCTLTSDGTGTPGNFNIANPQNNTSWAGSLVCNAHDSTNNTNAIAWVGVPVLLMTQTTAGSTTGAFGSLPTPLTLGTTAGASLTPTAETSHGGASLVFAAPTVNSAIWDITCHAPTVQTN